MSAGYGRIRITTPGYVAACLTALSTLTGGASCP